MVRDYSLQNNFFLDYNENYCTFNLLIIINAEMKQVFFFRVSPCGFGQVS